MDNINTFPLLITSTCSSSPCFHQFCLNLILTWQLRYHQVSSVLCHFALWIFPYQYSHQHHPSFSVFCCQCLSFVLRLVDQDLSDSVKYRYSKAQINQRIKMNKKKWVGKSRSRDKTFNRLHNTQTAMRREEHNRKIINDRQNWNKLNTSYRKLK